MTNQHLGTAPRQSTFATITGDGYEITMTVKGFVDTDSETFASEIFAIAAHAFNDVFSTPFKDQVLDMYSHEFQARLEDEAKPSEYDQGWAAGRQAALLEAEPDQITGHADESMVGKVLEVTSAEGSHGFTVGAWVTVVRDDEDGDPLGQYLVTTRADTLGDPEMWPDEWEEGVTAYVGPENTKKTWVDTPDES